jgi:hypothetical protein
MKKMFKHILGIVGCSLICLVVLFISFTSYLSGDQRRPSSRSAGVRVMIGSSVFDAYMALPNALVRSGRHDTSALHGNSNQTERRILIATILTTALYGSTLHGSICVIRRRRMKTANQAPEDTARVLAPLLRNVRPDNDD